MNYYYKYIGVLDKFYTDSNLKILEIDTGIKDFVNLFNNIHKKSNKKTKIILISINSSWKPIIYIAKKLGLTSLKESDGWVSLNQLENIANLTNFNVIEKGYRTVFPKYIPLLSSIINSISLKIPFLKIMGILQYIVLSKADPPKKSNFSCSIIVPCFNEEGNVEDCIKKCPKIGKFTELIIVNDGSSDKTYDIAKGLLKKYPYLRIISYSPNKGKAYAVEKGFDSAKGEVIMIWDADRTVPEEELHLFYDALSSGKARFANGTRLLYPMEDQAMKWLNLIGNKIVSIIFGWILNTPVSDTLCGTKALLKKDYRKIEMGNEPWGDFDLLFGASALNLKIVEIPVHYRKRVAGESKMKVFKHGLILAKMALVGTLRLKFKYAK